MIKKLSMLALVLFLALRCGAQSTTADLVGSVLDPSGAAIPGATIVATNVGTNVEHRAVSEKNGEYRLGQLPPGDYTISVEASGFSKLVQKGIALQVGQQSRLDLSLKVGAAGETVEVTGHPPLLETETSQVGNVVGERLVNQLPLNGRNFVQLATLSPGVTGVGQSQTGTIQSGTRPDDKRAGNEIFSNGNREGDNNFLLDGTDNNERLTLSLVLRPAVESVREFRIQTANYSADTGRNSGAVINVITKSGTNAFHGSLFEYIRNSAVDARTYFNRPPSAFPSFKLNQFGGSFGGPVRIPKLYNGKDRTFFFGDYEGFRNSTQAFAVYTVPTVAMRGGDFSQVNPIYDPNSSATVAGRQQFANNFIPVSRRDPIAMKMINAYPLPLTSGTTLNYPSSQLQTNNYNQFDVRIDETLTQKDSIFARYSYQKTTNIAPSTYPVTTLAGISTPVHLSDEGSFAGTSTSPTQHFTAAYTRVVTSNIVNDFRVGFNRYRLDYVPVDFVAGGGLGNQLGILNSNVTPREQNLPIFSPANYTGIGQTRSLPLYRRENTFQELDNLVWTHGTHTLKFGIDFRRRQLTIYQTNQGNGRFNFSPAFTNHGTTSTGDSMASFMLGYATAVIHDYTFQFPGIRLNEYGTYAADDWRVTKKLTLNYGLRWDYFSPPDEVLNRWANINLSTGKMDIPGRNGVNLTADVQPFKKDFGPRFGFAYNLFQNTVLQGGFGLFFNASGSESVNMRLARNTPFGATIQESPGDITPGTTVSQGFPTGNPAYAFFGPNPTVIIASADTPSGAQSGVEPGFKPGYAEQFNLGIQQAITPIDMVIKVTGVGNLGRRLYDAPNFNQPIPLTDANDTRSLNARRPLALSGANANLSTVTYATSRGLGEYYGLQFVADKRLRQGVNFLLGYSWSHSIDNVNLEFGGGAAGPSPQDPRFPRADRSNSVIDQRQRLTFSYLWMLPFGKGQHFLNHGGPAEWFLGGWQTNGILQSQTGLYFSPVLSSNNLNTGTSSRPNQTGPVSYPRTLAKWFDPSAYTANTPFQYGNAGRNSLIGPGRTNFDVSVLKTFTVHEDMNFQFRFEAFNVFNHPQFGLPNSTIGSGSVGVISSIVGTPRNLQASLRFQF